MHQGCSCMDCSLGMWLMPLPPSLRQPRTGFKTFTVGSGQRFQRMCDLSWGHRRPRPCEKAAAKRRESDAIGQSEIHLPGLIHNLVGQTAHRLIHHRKKQTLMDYVV